MADPSLFEGVLNNRSIQTPAFVFDPVKGYRPSEDSERVVNHLNSRSKKRFTLQPANSVMANNGMPIWGTGGGVVYNDDSSKRGVGYVDPLKGTVHTVAHEGAHVSFPSSLKSYWINRLGNNNTLDIFDGIESVNRDSGAKLRMVHELVGKPSLVEESHAQGVAERTLDDLGIPSVSSIPDFSHPLDYPSTFAARGIGLYNNTEIGPLSPGEQKEQAAILNGIPDLMNRVYKQGYNAW